MIGLGGLQVNIDERTFLRNEPIKSKAICGAPETAFSIPSASMRDRLATRKIHNEPITRPAVSSSGEAPLRVAWPVYSPVHAAEHGRANG
jgi:hypothetical protein